MKSVSKTVNNVIVTVDYRTELLGIIMLIGNYNKKFPFMFMNEDNPTYVNKIKERFSKYKYEEVVKEFDDLTQNHSFNYDAPLALFLELDYDFKSNKLSDYVLKRANDEHIYEFINKIESFAKKIEYEEWYDENKGNYLKWATGMSKTFEKCDVITFLNEYFGFKTQKNYFINLLPFTDCGGYSCFYDDKVYACISACMKTKTTELYDTIGHEKNAVKLPLHEFCHSYVNPITEKQNLVNDKTNVFDNIRENMKKKAYPYDSQILNEHIVRAVVARFYLLEIEDIKRYEKIIKKEKSEGYIYIDIVIKSLIEYESNRDKYPNFELFYPTLINKLKENI